MHEMIILNNVDFARLGSITSQSVYLNFRNAFCEYYEGGKVLLRFALPANVLGKRLRVFGGETAEKAVNSVC